MSYLSLVGKSLGFPEINLKSFFSQNKHVLDPEVDRLKQQAIDAIEAAFTTFKGSGGKIVTSKIKDALYVAVGKLSLPSFVAQLVTGVILAYDASKYEGQAISRLGELKDDLVKHIQGAHL